MYPQDDAMLLKKDNLQASPQDIALLCFCFVSVDVYLFSLVLVFFVFGVSRLILCLSHHLVHPVWLVKAVALVCSSKQSLQTMYDEKTYNIYALMFKKTSKL